MMFSKAIIPTFLVLLAAGLTTAEDSWEGFTDYIEYYDDDFSHNNGGTCYYDSDCTMSCGEAYSKEECMSYRYVLPNSDIVDVPYFVPDRYIDPFDHGPKPACQKTEENPKPVGRCCTTCEMEGMTRDEINAVCTHHATYVNPQTCLDNPDYVDRNMVYFLDTVDAAHYGNVAGCMTVEEAINKEMPDPQAEAPTPAPTHEPEDPRSGSGSGDPHFKTWTGDKFDYHGECDLTLVDNPTFMDGMGLKVHIRTTRIKYFSYIERIALQIGEDVLEFANNVNTFLINGKQVEPNKKFHKTFFAGFLVRRDKKALSIRLSKDYATARKRGSPHIDLIQREIGFPAVVVGGEGTDIFQGSLGLLGDYETGKRLARDGKTVLDGEDATEFALEWQVRDTEPLLFQTARYPQFPTQCTPPAKMLGKRLGSSNFRKEAEKVCASWKQDKEDCIFDVMATRDVLAAAGGAVMAS